MRLMQHKMRLKDNPFQMIKSGEKKIELRLFDEKRARLRKGDTLLFENVTTGEILVCQVIELYRYATFEELYVHHKKTEIGYREDEVADPKDMLAYYTQEDVIKYGVVGIAVERIQ